MKATTQQAKPNDRGREKSATGTTVNSFDQNIDAVLSIPVEIQVVLGKATMPVANLLKLGRGAVIPLNHRVGEPVDILVNGRVIARGEVCVMEDDASRFGVTLTEIVGNHIEANAL